MAAAAAKAHRLASVATWTTAPAECTVTERAERANQGDDAMRGARIALLMILVVLTLAGIGTQIWQVRG